MAYTEVDVETVGVDGTLVTKTAADVANGNSFDNDGKCMLLVIKGAGGTGCTLSFAIPDTGYGDAVTAETVIVPVNTSRVIGKFPVGRFNELAGDNAGQVLVDYGGDDTTNVTISPFV